MKIRAGIIGGAGYTGGEMIRILINHPDVEIAYVHSKSNAGKALSEVHEDLAGETDKKFDADWHTEIDVLFLCLGHGEAKKFLEEEARSATDTRASWKTEAAEATGATGSAWAAEAMEATGATGFVSEDARPARFPSHVKIIDLSQDYRLHTDGRRPVFNGQSFVYGLPELNREQIRSAAYIANPGCFATSIQLGLLPLAKAGLLGDVYTTGITGSTGAGQGLSPTSHFSWRANNIQAYKSLTHQHLKEIGQSLQQLTPAVSGFESANGQGSSGNPGSAGTPSIHFVPWRGDFTRGIFISSQLRCNRSEEELLALYTEFYHDHPFTVLSRRPISLKQVVNTNKCLLQLEKQGDQLVIHSALDNLLKGAAGQAVQNMNLLFGLDEKAGLHLKANAF